MNRWRRPTRPLVIAHRGHLLGAPEQTLAAYELAIRLGAEMIEADVRQTADGHLVMLHDATLERTTNGSGPLAEMGLAELRELDAGSWYGADFAGQRVPLLEELFDLASASGVGLCLEVKSDGGEGGSSLALAVAREIVARGRLDLDLLASFDHAALGAAARLYHGLALAPDRLPERGPSTAEGLLAQASAIGAPIIQHHHADLSREVVDACHAAGLAVWAWPTTEPAEIKNAYELSCDALMGDDVAAIVSLLQQAAPRA